MREFLIVAFLAMAAPSLAQTSADAFTDCEAPAADATAKTSGLEVGQTGKLCFDFDDDFTVGSESLAFSVTGEKAVVCLDPDRAGTAGAAVVDIQVCPTTDLASDDTCADTGLTLLAANPCEAIARGRYRFEVTTAAAGTEDAQITVQAY